jgi:class 3 adenylate cyclase
MHHQFLELLSRAKSESKPVIAVNLDVRGFSKFSLEVESVETAIYVRKMYEKILSDYFSTASFFKPTGDGLMLVFDIEEGDDEDLAKQSNQIVAEALRLVANFGSLLEKDEWIYFSPPQRVGIGIARGAASRLVADDLTLDYSGTVLNIASRLMDVARPYGLVLDETFPIGLLRPRLRKDLKEDERIFLRSVAESFPRRVYYNETWTEISPSNRRPLEKVYWKEINREWSFGEFLKLGNGFLIPLEGEPIDPGQILVRVDYPAVSNGAKLPELLDEFQLPPHHVEYQDAAGEHRLRLQLGAVAEVLSDGGVKKPWDVMLTVRYPT